MSAVARTLWRRPRLQLSLLLAGPVGWLVIAYLGSLAVLFVASLWQLDDFSGKIVQEPGLQNFQELIETPVYRHDRPAHRRDRGAGDDHRRDPRVPDRVLHGQGRVAAGAGAARRRGADAALVELPGQGLHVADHALERRHRELGARAVRAERPGLRERRHLARVLVPLAAVHDPADLRRAGADPELADRRVGRPRRAQLADLPARDPAAGAPRAGGGLDLHLLADARRLHHPDARVEHAVHRQRRLRQRRHRQQPAAGGGVRDRAGDDHDRLPADRPPAGRLRERSDAASLERHPPRPADRHRDHAGVHLHPADRDRASTRSTTRARSRGRSTGFTLDLVRQGVPQPGRARRALDLAEGGARAPRRSRSCSARSPRWPSRATASSGATRSRSWSCCRSPCRGSSPAWRSTRPSPRCSAWT